MLFSNLILILVQVLWCWENKDMKHLLAVHAYMMKKNFNILQCQTNSVPNTKYRCILNVSQRKIVLKILFPIRHIFLLLEKNSSHNSNTNNIFHLNITLIDWRETSYSPVMTNKQQITIKQNKNKNTNTNQWKKIRNQIPRSNRKIMM